MKKKFSLSPAALLPLVAVVILAVFGATLNIWVSIVLAAVYPLVAGIIWFSYKDVEKKMETARKEVRRQKKSS